MKKKRWYDKYEETARALELLKSLNADKQKRFSTDMINVASAIKTVNKDNEETPLSLGVERVLGLYQSGQSRRWYDKALFLSSAIKSVSTLPESDYLHVMESICMSAKQ